MPTALLDCCVSCTGYAQPHSVAQTYTVTHPNSVATWHKVCMHNLQSCYCGTSAHHVSKQQQEHTRLPHASSNPMACMYIVTKYQNQRVQGLVGKLLFSHVKHGIQSGRARCLVVFSVCRWLCAWCPSQGCSGECSLPLRKHAWEDDQGPLTQAWMQDEHHCCDCLAWLASEVRLMCC